MITPPYSLPTSDKPSTPTSQPVTGTVVIEGGVDVDVDFPEIQTVQGSVSLIGELEFDDTDLIEAIENLEFPTPPTTVAVSNQPDLSPLATEATLDNRYGGGKTPVCATVTASGDTDIYTPASGNAVRLFWITAINDPDEAATPLIKVLLGSTELYRVFAVGHWEIFEGAADDPLTVNLSAAASVAVTAHIQEYTP